MSGRFVRLMDCCLGNLWLDVALIRRVLLLFVLSVAEGPAKDGSAQSADGGSFSGFAAFVVADDGSEQSAKHGSGGCTAFGVVHGAGAADEHAGGEGEKDEFVFHNFSVF
jgi:hypothetical protein